MCSDFNESRADFAAKDTSKGGRLRTKHDDEEPEENEEEPMEVQESQFVETQELTERQKFAQALRDCADFFEAQPEVGIPVSLQTFYIFPEVKEIAAYAKAFGKCRKSGDETFFNLTKTFGTAIEVQAAWYRDRVCERVVVGKKKVEVPVMQEVGKRVEEQEIVEWKCPKVLQPLAPPEVMAEIES